MVATITGFRCARCLKGSVALEKTPPGNSRNAGRTAKREAR